ncbi:MAG: hypothetical protein ACKVI3_08125 [Verrucomicrobiia bacterium]
MSGSAPPFQIDGSDENSLRAFFERRRAFLLEHEEVKTAKRLSR